MQPILEKVKRAPVRQSIDGAQLFDACAIGEGDRSLSYRSILNNSSMQISDRVFLQRVHHFFGNGFYNAVSAMVGAAIVSLVLWEAGTPAATVYGWFSLCLLGCASVIVIDQCFKRASITLDNARQWLVVRILAGAVVGIYFGATPFMLPASAAIHHEMFLFIVISGMVSLSSSGYTLMPAHYLILSGVSMLPMIGYFLTKTDYLHYMLLTLAVVWPALVLTKALRVSRAAINALFINHQLIDESNEHKKTKEQLKLMATHDILTGLPNRRLLEERLSLTLAHARRYNRSICLMFLDLDGFKSINDTHGHQAGDETLREIADRLEGLSRESDIVARLGGDEFVIVFTEITDKANDPIVFAQRIISAIGQPVAIGNDKKIKVGASIGIALFPDDATDVERLLINADQAMYSAKRDGKNQFAHATAS